MSVRTLKDHTAASVIPATGCIQTNTTASVRSALTTVRVQAEMSMRFGSSHGQGRVRLCWARVNIFVNYGGWGRKFYRIFILFLINTFYFDVHCACNVYRNLHFKKYTVNTVFRKLNLWRHHKWVRSGKYVAYYRRVVLGLFESQTVDPLISLGLGGCEYGRSPMQYFGIKINQIVQGALTCALYHQFQPCALIIDPTPCACCRL